MEKLFQPLALGGRGKNLFTQRCAVEAAVLQQNGVTETINNVLQGWLAGLNYDAGFFVSVDDVDAVCGGKAISCSGFAAADTAS